MTANRLWRNGSFAEQEQPSTRTNSFPRSRSINEVTTTATSLLPQGQIMSARSAAKTTDDLPPPLPTILDDDTSNSSPGQDWGDDDEFYQLLCQTQEPETSNEQRNGVPSPLRQRHPSLASSTGSKLPRMNSDEEIQTGNILAFRARLAEQETSTGTLSNNNGLGPSTEEMEKSAEKITVLETDNANYKSEINKLRGEVANLRRANDKLNKEQQADVQARLRLRFENCKDLEESKAAVLKLQNEVLILKGEQMKNQWSKKKSLENSSIASDMDISSVIQTPSPPPQRSRSQTQTKSVSTFRNATTVSVTVIKKQEASPRKVHCHVQTEESSLSNSPKKSLPQPLTTSTNPNPLYCNVPALSPTPLNSVETREMIFQKIEQIVELQYQLILPTLREVVKTAPSEIMRRLVRNVELKSAFPGVVDTMFQWGMDQERKNARAISGLKEPRPPMLPSRFESGTEYYVIKNAISTSFTYGGTWGALSEVRGWLEKILKSLEGAKRFRIYEYNTLTNFWRLLFWGNEFWRGLLSEEENEEFVLKNKSRWVKELRDWTGLVLKSDWRDYFALDLEIEVRKLSLGILENIVTAGYFEQSKNRYETLYLILKDVLIHDAFRNISNIQHVLRIVNWSISDLMIFKHLCYKTNETNTCLARLIGENVLKVCREAGPIDSVSVARLYMDYASLLETLISEKPPSYHQSNYARQSTSDGEDPPPVQLQNSEEMVDASFCEELMPASQYACPIKYNAQPIVQPMEVDEEEEPLESLACCWLDPAKYEDPFGRLKLCQCRKVLMGTAIHLLKIMFNSWSQRYLEYEKEMENQEIAEQEELARLQFITSVSPRSRKTPPTVGKEYKSPDSIQINQHGERDQFNYLQQKSTTKKELIPIGQETFQGRSHLEWNWDDCIREKTKLPVTDTGAKANFLPPCIMEFKRRNDIFDLALCKGVVLMNFIHNKVDNLAAMLGTDAYKTYMMLKALLRLNMDRIHFTRIERDLLTAITPECEEDHLGAALTQAGQEQPENFKPVSVTKKSDEYPIPLTPVDNNILQEEWNDLAVQSPSERKTVDEKLELLEREEKDYEDEDFVLRSGPYTYRPIRQKRAET